MRCAGSSSICAAASTVRSTPGKGTEVTLRLPLTLAIIEGLLVRVCGGAFVIPLWSVEECVELPESELARRSGRSPAASATSWCRSCALDAQFGFEPSDAARRRVVIVRADGRGWGWWSTTSSASTRP
jgi:two-component system chemotaxis sensor kinase CheA